MLRSIVRHASIPLRAVSAAHLPRSSAILVARNVRSTQLHFRRTFCSPAASKVEEAQVVEDTSAAHETHTQETPASILPPSNEHVTGESQQHTFQTETQKILSIVAQSLYTEREVFVRELISNASDALEKLRHLQVVGKEIEDRDKPLEIHIYADEATNSLVIQDSGIGMTKDDLIKNLGRIGHSGSAEFLKKMGESVDRSSIIGQFGVGFYSSFMVANNVKVYSRSAEPGSKGYLWQSDGSGSYTIAEADGVARGTKIILDLKEAQVRFADKKEIEGIIRKYSNFVGFPIVVNGDRVNTVKALWLLSKDQVSEEEHKEFYQFIARAYDTPTYKLHYATDAPLNIRGLFYFPSQHMEKYGYGRMEPGVSLFSRKVLITPRAKDLLPPWLRFVKGVVDSEDIPLNISREHMQDSSLIMKLSAVLTKRILKFLETEAIADPEAYMKWYAEFSTFLKEGAATDFKWKGEVARVLRFASSAIDDGKVTSFDDYISRMPEGQREIYYLVSPNRETALASPYYEGFKVKKWEVLFMYGELDDIVANGMGEFNGRKLTNIESTKVELEVEKDTDSDALTEQQVDELCIWMRETLAKRVTIVRETRRLHKSPAIITDHESASQRRIMRTMDPSRMPDLPKQQLEINAQHPVVKGLYHQKSTHPVLAREIAEQLLDNAMVAAGILDDSRTMLSRLNRIMEASLQSPTDLQPEKQAKTPKAKKSEDDS